MFPKLNSLLEKRVEIPVAIKGRNNTSVWKLLGGRTQLIVMKISLAVKEVLTEMGCPTKRQIFYPCHHI